MDNTATLPDPLLTIARDLTASLASSDRYQRLLAAAQRLVPFDAACLLRLEGDRLVPLAGHGLVPEALERSYHRAQHPRLDQILRSDGGLRFAADSPLPDPFDGLIAEAPEALHHVHACCGWPLRDGSELVGVLTADALDPDAFDQLEPSLLDHLGALAGAALRTSMLFEAVEHRAERQGLLASDLLRDQAASNGSFLGHSSAARNVLRQVDIVAASDLPVLITGETGVGKELIAHTLHARSRRRSEPFIQLNCAALPDTLAESELFGHVAGAFTGASVDRAGKFEIADGGSLLLDEIGELPLAAQASLLRTLESGEIQRIGSDRQHRVDVRIIAATNRDLAREIERGRFRADLYHRLAGYPIEVPSLAARREDIPLLAERFAEQSHRQLGLGRVHIPAETLDALQAANWAGNVRELRNVIQRGLLTAVAEAGDSEQVELLARHMSLRQADEPERPPAQPAGENTAARPLHERVDAYQRRCIQDAVAACDGNWAAAARRLGLHRSNLHRLAGRLGLR